VTTSKTALAWAACAVPLSLFGLCIAENDLRASRCLGSCRLVPLCRGLLAANRGPFLLLQAPRLSTTLKMPLSHCKGTDPIAGPTPSLPYYFLLDAVQTRGRPASAMRCTSAGTTMRMFPLQSACWRS
jgi:hypothetical protein